MTASESPSPDAAVEPAESQRSAYSLAQMLLLVVACGTFLALTRRAYEDGRLEGESLPGLLAGLLTGIVVGAVRARHFDLRTRSVALGSVVGGGAGLGAALLMQSGMDASATLVGCVVMLLVAGGTRWMSRRGSNPDAAPTG